MEIGEQRIGDLVVLQPVGRINNETSPAFQAKLFASMDSTDAAVLLDFSAVEYISSAGLRVLMMAAKQSKAGSGRLAVAGLTPLVSEIFEISRFAHVVQVFETPEAGITALRAPGIGSTEVDS